MSRLRAIPWWAWILLAGAPSVYFGFKAAIWLLFRHVGVTVWPADTLLELRVVQLFIVGAVSCGYGAGRALAFHPAAHKGYREWLRSTPWRPDMRLPLGPVAFAWWDALILCAAVAAAHRDPIVVLTIFLAFAAGYVILASVILCATLPWCAYAIALGAAFCFRFALSIHWVLAIAAVLLVFANVSMVWSLRSLRWEDGSRDGAERVGWLMMIPPDLRPLVPTRVAVAACMLVACWVWAVASMIAVQSPIGSGDAIWVAIWIGAAGGFGRFVSYCGPYRSPLSLFGRMLSGRLLIPGYDYVLLAPVGAPFAAGGVSAALAWLATPPPLILAAGIAAGLATVLMGPPTFREWELTGYHRRAPFRKDTPVHARRRANSESYALLLKG